MTRIEQMGTIASRKLSRPGPALLVVNSSSPRSNVVPISSARRRGPELMRPELSKRHQGRKGRKVLARRGAIDGIFLMIATATVALVWWSAF